MYDYWPTNVIRNKPDWVDASASITGFCQACKNALLLCKKASTKVQPLKLCNSV